VSAAAAERFEQTLAGGGVVLFPADTVYGLAADPESPAAVERLYAVKGRPAGKPAAVMFFSRDAALAALGEVGERTRAALLALLPGPVTVVLENPDGLFPLACGPDPGKLGVRVPALAGPAAVLGAVSRPVLQSSANPSGGPEPRRLSEVAAGIRAAVDLELDGGELPGTASTVVDLTGYERAGTLEVLREGAVEKSELLRRLGRTA